MKDNIKPYLRVVTTTRCNHSCYYCSREGRSGTYSTDISLEDVVLAARCASRVGIDKIHFTGGEPLLHPNILDFISTARKVAPTLDVGLTTNGVLLQEFAHDLASGGLRRINISVPSLQRTTFADICGFDNLGCVLAGIQSAIEEGLRPIKLNIVVIKANVREIGAYMSTFASLEMVVLRFLITLPYNETAGSQAVSEEAVRDSIAVGLSAYSSKLRKSLRKRIVVRPLQPATHPRCRICAYQSLCGERALAVRLTPDGLLRPCLLNPSFAEPFSGSADPVAALRRALGAVTAEPTLEEEIIDACDSC